MSLTGWTSKDPQPHIKEFPSSIEAYEFLRKAKIDAGLEIPRTLYIGTQRYVFNDLTRNYDLVTGKVIKIKATENIITTPEPFNQPINVLIDQISIEETPDQITLVFEIPGIGLNDHDYLNNLFNNSTYVFSIRILNSLNNNIDGVYFTIGTPTFDGKMQAIVQGLNYTTFISNYTDNTIIRFQFQFNPVYNIKHSLGTLTPSIFIHTSIPDNTTDYNYVWVPKFTIIDENTIQVPVNELYIAPDLRQFFIIQA